MTRLQEVVKVFDEFFKVSTAVEIKETMVFKCDEKGNIFNIDNPVFEDHYTTREEAEQQHKNLVSMYRETQSIGFTMDKWNGSILDTLEELDPVHEDVVMELINALPPRKYSKYVAQVGERHSHEGYMTFRKEYGVWYYVGLEN